MPYSWLDYNIGLNFIPKKILPDLIPEGLFLSKSIKITAISTIFFYTVQDLVCILKNALSWIFSVCKGNTDTQGNCRGTILCHGKPLVDSLNLVADGILEITGHLHHDNGKLISTDPAHIVDASERILEKLRYFLEDLVRLSCAESALSSVESYTSRISSGKDSSDLP